MDWGRGGGGWPPAPGGPWTMRRPWQGWGPAREASTRSHPQLWDGGVRGVRGAWVVVGRCGLINCPISRLWDAGVLSSGVPAVRGQGWNLCSTLGKGVLRTLPRCLQQGLCSANGAEGAIRRELGGGPRALANSLFPGKVLETFIILRQTLHKA